MRAGSIFFENSAVRRLALSRARVLLCDDHGPLLQVVTALLLPYFDVVGTAKDGTELVSKALYLDPDVVVTDISMPGLSGIEVLRELQRFGSSAKVVFLTTHSDEEFVSACIAEGASGYVPKHRIKAHLISAIEAAFAGQTFISS